MFGAVINVDGNGVAVVGGVVVRCSGRDVGHDSDLIVFFDSDVGGRVVGFG
jgi:carbon monoxide dehydrogenase subunit G